jgi:hypothetical protein
MSPTIPYVHVLFVESVEATVVPTRRTPVIAWI